MVEVQELLYDHGDTVTSESLTPDSDYHFSPTNLAKALELFRPKGCKPSRPNDFLAVVLDGGTQKIAYPIFLDDVLTYASVDPYVGEFDYSPMRALFSDQANFRIEIFIFDQSERRLTIKLVYDRYIDDWEVSGNLVVDKGKIATLCEMLYGIGLCLPGDLYD